MQRKDWNRIGLAAVVLFVPGGFLLGGALAVRRLRTAGQHASADAGTRDETNAAS